MLISALTKNFGTVTAVDSVSLAIKKPQMVGIIGPSGAGKSTLLRMINRLTPATKGTIEVDGENILE
ncbi:MAG: ATP-binding cassette domain-containing protein, partial [Desulfonatronovibrio sp.]